MNRIQLFKIGLGSVVNKRRSSRIRATTHCAAFACYLLGSTAAAAEAEEQLAAMARALATVDRYSVDMHITYDAVQASGRQVEFAETRRYVLDRPSRLRADVKESDGDSGGLIFDGEFITQFNNTANVYSRIEQPGDVDATLRYALAELRMRMPLARLLRTTFPEELEKLNSQVDHVETNVLGPEPFEHVAGRLERQGVDYQVWIGPDNLPRRIVLTYRTVPGEPQFRAQFSNWNLEPEISDTTFAFVPPAGAEEIPTVKRISGVTQ